MCRFGCVVKHIDAGDPKVVESKKYTPPTAFFPRPSATYRPQGVVGQCIQQYMASVLPIRTQSVVIHTHTLWPSRPWASPIVGHWRSSSGRQWRRR